MRPLILEFASEFSPESLVERLRPEPGVVLLRTPPLDNSIHVSVCPACPWSRYSIVAAHPFLTFRSFGSRCELESAPSGPGAAGLVRVQFGNPWSLLDQMMARYELLDQWDLPFPLGGCFGFWGYDLKNFTEPKLPRRAAHDLDLPGSHLGFYDSLVVFDHSLGKTWIVSTGLAADGCRCIDRAESQLEFWQSKLDASRPMRDAQKPADDPLAARKSAPGDLPPRIRSNSSRDEFLASVRRAQEYIRMGHIYQVNLSQRLAAAWGGSGWELYRSLSEVSPAPFSAFLDCGDFQIASSSPELFLRLSGRHLRTRPIKGTRPRSPDANRDAQLAYELQTSAKEMAELVMITDLLRNDVGKICEFGSVQTPELVRLERFAQVQHLVSTVEGRLRSEITHARALALCFPGGSITGAPKFRAMELIDELESTVRGPYTGVLGYLGFNRESQLSMIIRAAVCKERIAYFQVGAGIVADSNPVAEYEETLAKARGFVEALNRPPPSCHAAQIAESELRFEERPPDRLSGGPGL